MPLAAAKAEDEFMTADLSSGDADAEEDVVGGVAMGSLSVGKAGSLGRGRFTGVSNKPFAAAADAPASEPFCC